MRSSSSTSGSPEVSVVMPCLNEADTVATCVRKSLAGLNGCGTAGEVVVADNGSQDGSQQLALAAGARIVSVTRRGYGAALKRGIECSRGRFVIMGDADDSYDFGEVPKFVERLRQGADLVQGCRFPSGGGVILPGAMPWSHRYFGNPLISLMARNLLACGFRDVYCGMRGFRRDLFDALNLKCDGMEFAIEMLAAAAHHGARLDEVPITLHPDGRIAHGPHLRTVRDGLRSLRFLTRTWFERRQATPAARPAMIRTSRTQEVFATTQPD